MNTQISLSRRRFMGGMAAILGSVGLEPALCLSASGAADQPVVQAGGADYDSLAKLCFNENPYAPSPAVLEAMTKAFQYANRYGYPDHGITREIATYHGVDPDNVLLGAGSTEILEAADMAFLAGRKKAVGVEPTFSTVYEFAIGLSAGAIRLPLLPDHNADIPALIKTTCENQSDVGFVYLCNPNNPTGVVVKKQQIKQLVEGIPEHIPVLIDEAYHHFVEDPDYASSVQFVRDGRPVIIARTFSKIAALAGLRLGYAIAPAALIDRMRPFTGNMHVSVVTKWGGVAALKDSAGQNEVRTKILATRKKTTSQLKALGYDVLPSEANFFMVNLRRPVMPVISAFRQKGILVGRPFPPMHDYLRVSVGTPDEMERFMAAFKEILVA
jgi:histidinol-phosphate aminotransferase